jgi:deoxyribose-phosphate aldolase
MSPSQRPRLKKVNQASVARLIDYTYLKAHAPDREFSNFLSRAAEFPFACVIVPPFTVSRAVKYFNDNGLERPVGTVISFPLGFDSLPSKLDQIRRATESGASEVDVVNNIALLRSEPPEYEAEITELVAVAHSCSVRIKIILETAVLTDEEIVTASRIVSRAGADFIKTSTGSFGNPTPQTVGLILDTVGDRTAIKASGGIRTLADTLAFVHAGASRIGTSSGYEIVKECPP